MKDINALLQSREVQTIIKLALLEDNFRHDVTSNLIIPEHLESQAVLLAKAEGVLSGGGLFAAVFQYVDAMLSVDLHKTDGSKLKVGDTVAVVSGNARSILRAERTALNFVGHLSGIASATSIYIVCTNGTEVRIVDTRKTLPGLRLLEKYAVTCGGGKNHRFNLSDGILIKDNHIAALQKTGLNLREIVARAKKNNRSGLEIEVEVTSLEQAEEATAAGAGRLLLDNMSIEQMRRTVTKLKGQVIIEASGGITLQNVRAVAETGVDIISIGALTHSVKAFDFSLEIS